jgi:DNA-binding NtrC family response regulator
MPIEKIVVLEDDPIQRKNLESLLRYRRYDVASVTTIAAAEEILAKDNFDLMLVDVQLPDGDGTELLRRIQQKPSRPLVVIMTAFGSIEAAVDCMRDGAFHYLVKPFSAEQLEIILKKAEEFTQLLKVNRFFANEELNDERYSLLGESSVMTGLRNTIERVARADATVLIQGESGTGKELVARAIYSQSPRVGAPFIRVNCAAVPENLIESEFFGHERGAFTGAISRREGRFELANKGTILLDEVSEVSPQVQAKLLRVLQEQEFERVGGARTIKVDVRVIATTNRNMEESIERKEFRADLFYRLNVVPLFVPPLRERMEDVPVLAEAFRKRFARQHGREVVGISDACNEVLLSHRWPGNVRELQNVIERAVIMCDKEGLLEPGHLGFVRRGDAPGPVAGAPATSSVATASSAPSHAAPSTPVFRQPESPQAAGVAGGNSIVTLQEIEKRHILAALAHTNGNRTRAAELLQISIRTLRNKLNEYNYKALSAAQPGAEGV